MGHYYLHSHIFFLRVREYGKECITFEPCVFLKTVSIPPLNDVCTNDVIHMHVQPNPQRNSRDTQSRRSTPTLVYIGKKFEGNNVRCFGCRQRVHVQYFMAHDS